MRLTILTQHFFKLIALLAKGHKEPKRMGSSCILGSENPMRNSVSTPLAANAKLANTNADCQYSH